jgi:putative transcriptional regulator
MTKTKHDWSRLDAMGKEQRHRAARTDPDAKPLTDADMDRMSSTPRLKIIRRALGLTQVEFATRYQIPAIKRPGRTSVAARGGDGP